MSGRNIPPLQEDKSSLGPPLGPPEARNTLPEVLVSLILHGAPLFLIQPGDSFILLFHNCGKLGFRSSPLWIIR